MVVKRKQNPGIVVYFPLSIKEESIINVLIQITMDCGVQPHPTMVEIESGETVHQVRYRYYSFKCLIMTRFLFFATF